MAEIWDDTYLQDLTNDGEEEFADRVIRIFERKSLAISKGVATISLPSDFIKLVQLTWKGVKLLPLTREQLSILDHKYLTHENTPDYYTISMDGLLKLRFYPVPNENINADDSDLYDGAGIRDRVILSYYRLPDTSKTSFEVPDYLARRTIKYYVLSKAFKIESPGQRVDLADYYEERKRTSYSFAEDIMGTLYYTRRRRLGGHRPIIRQRTRRDLSVAIGS